MRVRRDGTVDSPNTSWPTMRNLSRNGQPRPQTHGSRLTRPNSTICEPVSNGRSATRAIPSLGLDLVGFSMRLLFEVALFPELIRWVDVALDAH